MGMLEELIGRCNVRQLELTSSVIGRRKPAMHSDFTRSFPRVLTIYIFSFLDPRSLSRCAQVMHTMDRVTVTVSGHLYIWPYCGMNPLLKRSDLARDSKGITQFYLAPTHEP